MKPEACANCGHDRFRQTGDCTFECKSCGTLHTTTVKAPKSPKKAKKNKK